MGTTGDRPRVRAVRRTLFISAGVLGALGLALLVLPLRPREAEPPPEKAQQILDTQREHWEITFGSRPAMFGTQPSYPAQQAAELFRKAHTRKVLELGCGQGRDALFLAGLGFEVTALDYSERGLQDLRTQADQAGVNSRLTTLCHDIRAPLPFDDGSFDACFSHMLYCMALTTAELEALSAEIRRVLRPGGLNLYTVRNTHDPGYRRGTHRGEDMYQDDGGFIVHFFSREKVQRLARGYELTAVQDFEEGELPKRLYLVTLKKGPSEPQNSPPPSGR